MFNEFQPPSPTLSPTSQIKIYQSHLDKAHNMIDSLEETLAIKKKIHESYETFQSPIPQRTSLSRSDTRETHPFSPYVQELHQRHTDLVSQSREEHDNKSNRLKELQQKVQNLRTILDNQKEEQSQVNKQRDQLKISIQRLQSDKEAINVKLNNSKQLAQSLAKENEALDEEKIEYEQKYYLPKVKVNQPKKEHKILSEQMKELNASIQDLKRDKAQQQSLYSSKIQELNNVVNRRSLIQRRGSMHDECISVQSFGQSYVSTSTKHNRSCDKCNIF